ncbi:hypothetical protein [Niveibacterium terrae]|uniref:hypothetical protein n=1 Tax=Niveibacterium terrae TaxID=3373598 RepID=UPI003A910760
MQILQFESRWAKIVILVAVLLLTRLLFQMAGYQEALDELFSAKALVHLFALIGMGIAIEDLLVRISRSRLFACARTVLSARRG